MVAPTQERELFIFSQPISSLFSLLFPLCLHLFSSFWTPVHDQARVHSISSVTLFMSEDRRDLHAHLSWRDFSINIRIVYHIIPCTSHSRFLILTFLFTPLVLSFAPLLCLCFHVDLVSSCIISVRTAIGRTACSVRDIHKFVMPFISPCHPCPYERGAYVQRVGLESQPRRQKSGASTFRITGPCQRGTGFGCDHQSTICVIEKEV